MAIFGPKQWVNPFGKMPIFEFFLTSCFYSLESLFFVLEYRKIHFRGIYYLKKKRWKNGHFWTKTMDQLLWKNLSFWTFSTACYYSLERGFFALEYHKTHFPGLDCLIKQRWKNGQFRIKTMD